MTNNDDLKLKAVIDRLNLSGYETKDGGVTRANITDVVGTLLQQLDDAASLSGALLAAHAADKKRIAELEANIAQPVRLPKTNGYWTEQEKAYEEAIMFAKRQIRLAGFNVEDM